MMRAKFIKPFVGLILSVLAMLFGVNGSVLLAEASNLPDAGKTESGSSAEAGGTNTAGGTGEGGAGKSHDGIANETDGRENGDPEFYSKDIDKKITKIRPMATPIDQISRFATAEKCGSFEVKYYAVGTRPIKTSVKTATTQSSGTSMKLEVEDPSMFTLDDTIRVVGIKAITDYKGTLYSTYKGKAVPDLELCVCGKADDGQPIVYAVNGSDVGGQPLGIPVIAKGTTLVRMGKSCGELDVQTGRFNNLPTSETQYCQNFMIQVEQSTFDKIAAKEVEWNFTDLEEDTIYDMRLAMENTYLFGDMGKINHTTKDGMAQWFTKGLWWMAGKDIELGHKATDEDKKHDYNEGDIVITDNELVDISKDLFVGTGIGNKRKVIIAGSDVVTALSKIKSEKFRLKDSVEVWNMKFKSWETDFGELDVIHSELFDLNGMSDCAFALDPEFLKKKVHLPWFRNVLDLKKAGIRNTDAVVIQEVACLYLTNPKAHARLKLASAA